MKDKFQILRDFANSNNKPDKTIYQFIKEILDMNSAYAKENRQLKQNWNKLKEWASNFYNSEEVGWAGCGMRYTLEKMQEIEQGSDSNVKK